MDHILVINSSTSGEGSVSRALVEDAVQLLLASEPDAVVTRRDLGDDPIPHLTPGTVAGVRAVVATEDELVTSSLSDDLIAEIREATVLVIGAPMYNFNIPSPLRTWFDHVLRPRVTFLLHEPDRSLQGHAAIARAVSELVDGMPADFTFSAIRQGLGHHNLGRLQWRLGPADGPAAMTGTDVVHIQNGRIRTIHVFLDQTKG